jgi:hypothetical protein
MDVMAERAPDQPVDVDRLMAEIRARVSATGGVVDQLFRAAPGGRQEIVAEAQLARVEDVAIITPDLTVGRSTRRIVGPLIGRVRGFVIRANANPLYSLASQQTRLNAELIGYVRALGTELATTRRRLERLEASLDSSDETGGADSPAT